MGTEVDRNHSNLLRVTLGAYSSGTRPRQRICYLSSKDGRHGKDNDWCSRAPEEGNAAFYRALVMSPSAQACSTMRCCNSLTWSGENRTAIFTWYLFVPGSVGKAIKFDIHINNSRIDISVTTKMIEVLYQHWNDERAKDRRIRVRTIATSYLNGLIRSLLTLPRSIDQGVHPICLFIKSNHFLFAYSRDTLCLL